MFASKRGLVLNRLFPMICIKWSSEREELFPHPELWIEAVCFLPSGAPAMETERQGPSLFWRASSFFPAWRGLCQLLGWQ